MRPIHLSINIRAIACNTTHILPCTSYHISRNFMQFWTLLFKKNKKLVETKTVFQNNYLQFDLFICQVESKLLLNNIIRHFSTSIFCYKERLINSVICLLLISNLNIELYSDYLATVIRFWGSHTQTTPPPLPLPPLIPTIILNKHDSLFQWSYWLSLSPCCTVIVLHLN